MVVNGYTTNTEYMLSRTVGDEPVLGLKTVRVSVAWLDRAGQNQTVTLNSLIARADPALSGALSLAPSGAPVRQPLGRQSGIPVQARDLGNGTSGFKPPGSEGGGVVWVFNNLTGVVVGVCNGVATAQDDLTTADVESCSNNANGLPLSGYVRFATGSTQPTAVNAEHPASSARNLDVALALTSTGHATPDHVCYADAPKTALTTSKAVAYWCVIFFNLDALPRWSGTSTLTPLAFVEPADDVAWTLATDAADTSASRYRVCRYTLATSDAQAIPNQWHPRTYTDVPVGQTLTNQNFLVIRAGDGTVAFQCPTDVPPDPAAGDFVNSNTLPHQPPP